MNKPNPQWRIDEAGDVFQTGESEGENGHYGRVGTYQTRYEGRPLCHWGCFPFEYENGRKAGGFFSGDCSSVEEGKRRVEEAFNKAWETK